MKEILLEKNTGNNLEKENNIELENTKNIVAKEQKSFLETNLGKVINSGLNIGLRLALPNFIEEQVIDVKDILMSQGLKDGVKTIVDDVSNFGKNVASVASGNLENISQLETVIKNAKVIDTTSDLLGIAIDLAKDKKLLKSSTATILKKGKNIILDSVSNSLEDMVANQVKSVEKLNKYVKKWEEAYKDKNIETMKREYKKINTEMNKIIPLENTIKTARKIENIHNLIMNNGNNFNLSKDELELAKKLV